MLVLVLLLALANGAMAEGMDLADTEIVSGTVDSLVPEEEVDLSSGVEADTGNAVFAGDAAVSATTGSIAVDKAHFPDAAFRSYVRKQLDSDGDGVLSKSEIASVNYIEVVNCGITDLKGIEWFTNLIVLYCGDNPIVDLDVSKNVYLTNLSCGGTQIANLDVSKNTKLNSLDCGGNPMKSIDLSHNTALRSFACEGSLMESIDLSHNKELSCLWLTHNDIPYVDISNCPALCRAAVQNPFPLSGPGGEVICFEIESVEAEQIVIDSDSSLIANGKALYGKLPEPEPTVAPKESIKEATVTVKDVAYTGKALKPAVTVKLGKKTLKKGTDYTVKYANNVKVGKATVTVKGKGSYTGTVKASFSIKPKKVSGLKLKAGKKKLTVTWKKSSGASGYQLQYATKKDFSNAKKSTVKKAATVKATLKKLKAKKTYYVRIRAYKKVKGTTYYSAWVSAKKKTK